MQDHALTEIARKRDVRLQRDAFFTDAREQIAQARDGGVSAIRRDQHFSFDGVLIGSNRPVVRQTYLAHGSFLKNFSSGFASARHQEMIKQTSLHRDLGAVRQRNRNCLSIDADKIDALEFPVRQRTYAIFQVQSSKHRPAGRI